MAIDWEALKEGEKQKKVRVANKNLESATSAYNDELKRTGSVSASTQNRYTQALNALNNQVNDKSYSSIYGNDKKFKKSVAEAKAANDKYYADYQTYRQRVNAQSEQQDISYLKNQRNVAKKNYFMENIKNAASKVISPSSDDLYGNESPKRNEPAKLDKLRDNYNNAETRLATQKLINKQRKSLLNNFDEKNIAVLDDAYKSKMQAQDAEDKIAEIRKRNDKQFTSDYTMPNIVTQNQTDREIAQLTSSYSSANAKYDEAINKLVDIGYSKKDAKKLVVEYAYSKQKEEQQNFQQGAEDYAKEHPYKAELASFGLSAVNALNSVSNPLGIVQQYADVASGRISDFNAAQAEINALQQGVVDKVREEHPQGVTIAGVRYDAGEALNMLNGALNSGITMGVGALVGLTAGNLGGGLSSALGSAFIGEQATTLIMGSQIASDKLIEEKQNGASDSKAIAKSVLYGAATYLAENIAIDDIFKGNIKKAVIGEGLEEVAENVMDSVADLIVDGGQDVKLEIANKIVEGKTYDEALAEVLEEKLGENLESFVSGALSGGLMAGAAKPANLIQQSNQNIKIGTEFLQDNNSKQYADLMDVAKSLSNDKAISKLYTEVKSSSTKTIEPKTIGKLHSAITEHIANEFNDVKTVEQANDVMKNVAKYATNNTYAEYALDAYSNAVENVTKPSAKEKVSNLISNAKQMLKIGKNSAENKAVEQKTSSVTPKTENALNELTKPISTSSNNAITSVKVNNGTVELINDEGNKVTASQLDDNIKSAISYVEGKSLGTAGANVIVDYVNRNGSITDTGLIYEANGKTVDIIDIAYNASKQYNTYDEFLNAIKKSSPSIFKKLSKNSIFVNKVFEAGKNDFNEKQKAEKKTTFQNALNSERKSGVTNLSTNATAEQKQQIEMIDEIAKQLNQDVIIVDNTVDVGERDANGFYVNGKIVLALDNQVNALNVYFGHELFHHLMKTAPAEARALRDFVVDRLSNDKAYNLEDRISGLIELNGFEDRQINGEAVTAREQALEEIAANACFTVFTSKENVDAIVKQNKTLAEKIADFFKNLFQKLQKAYTNLANINAEYSALHKDIETVNKIVEMFGTALEASQGVENTNVDTKPSIKEHQNKLNRQIDNWDGKTTGFTFNFGKPSKELLKAGIPNKEIRLDASKLVSLLNKHNGMDKNVVKNVYSLLQNPVIVIDSKQNNNSKIVMGNLKDNNGKTVTCVLLLNPKSVKNNDLDIIKISSTQGRGHLESLFSYKNGGFVNIRYIDKNRVQKWLNDNRLQSLPLRSFILNSNDSISNPNENVKLSAKEDSQGNKLSNEQIEYFKDSKIRDNEGRLLVVYHGTPNEFTVFDNRAVRYSSQGHYFTDSKDYANGYSRRTGNVLKGYINITKPFELSNEDVRNVFINDYVKGGYAQGISPYSTDAEIRAYIENGIDWTEGDNLIDFIEENELDYDGLILNEGGDSVANAYGNKTIMRGLSYVIFNSNQFKNADNLNPTKNEDIRYSKREKVAKRKKSKYNEYKTNAKIWAFSNDTNVGDTNIFNRNGNEFVLIESTKQDEGYIELISGNYSNVRDEYESIYKQKNTSIYEDIAEIRSEQRTDLWNIEYDENGTNGAGNSEQVGRTSIQNNTTTNNEYLLRSNKENQFSIIQNSNPMLDDIHTGIRSVDEIKTFDEAIKGYEDGVTPDFSKYQINKALKDGVVTIYSSNPIENGAFVTPSKMMAEDYAGGRKIYSKRVPLTDVAWIDAGEGQYANAEEYKQYSAKEERRIANLTNKNEELKDIIDNLQKRVKALARENEDIRSQLGVEDKRAISQKSIEKVATSLMKEYGGEKSYKKTLVSNLSSLYNYIADAGTDIDGAYVWQQCKDIATNLASNTNYRNTELYDEYKEVRDYIRNTRIRVSDQIKEDMPDFDNWRKRNFGRIKTGDSGVELDALHYELVALAPAFFSEDTVLSEQLEEIESFFEATNITYSNSAELRVENEGISFDDLTDIIASQIFDEYFDTTEIKQYISTSNQEEIAKLKAEYDKRIEELKSDYKNAYEDELAFQKESFNNEITSLKQDIARLEQERAESGSLVVSLQEQRKRDRLKALEEKADAIAETKAHFNELNARARDRRKASEYRNKIKKIKNNLDKALLNPTESQFIPRGLVQEITNICDMLTDAQRYWKNGNAKADSTISRLDALQREYEKLKNDADYNNIEAYDETTSQMLSSLAERINGKQLSALTTTELEDIYTLLKAVSHQIVKARELFNSKLKINAHQASVELIRQQLEEVKGSKSALRGLFDYETQSVLRMINLISEGNKDGILNVLYDDLNKARRKADYNKAMWSKPFMEMLHSKEFKNFRKNDIDTGLKDINGNAVMVSEDVLASLILTAKREQGQKHILGGGVNVIDENKLRDGDYKGARDNGLIVENLSVDDIISLYDKLSDFGKQWIDEAHKLFTSTTKQAINETSFETKGYKIATDANYIPLFTDPMDTKQEIQSVLTNNVTAEMGFTKALTPNASNRIMIMPLSMLVDKYIEDVAYYTNIEQQVKNINKVLNGKTSKYYDSELLATHNRKSISVKETLNNKWKWNNRLMDKVGNVTKGRISVDATTLIENSMKDLRGISWRNPTSPFINILNSLQSNRISAVFKMNLSIVLKQAASYPTAALYLNPVALAYGAKTYANITPKQMQKVIDRSLEYGTATLYTRTLGLSDRELGDYSKRKLAEGKSISLYDPANWIQLMDTQTVSAIFVACEEQIKMQNKGIDTNSKEYKQKVVALFDETVENTQPMYDSLHRPEIQKQNDIISMSVAMFQTQPLQMTGMLYNAMREVNWKQKAYNADKSDANKSALNKARKDAANAVWAITSSAIVYVGMSSAVLKLLRKERKKPIEYDVIQNLLNVLFPVIGSIALSFYDEITSENSFGSSNMIENFILKAINDYFQNIIDLFNTTDINKRKRLVLKLLNQTAMMLGVPADNIKNNAHAIIGWIDSLDGKIDVDLTLSSVKYNTASLYDAYMLHGENSEEYKEIYDEIVKDKTLKGTDDAEKSINNALRAKALEQYIETGSEDAKKLAITLYGSADKFNKAVKTKQDNAKEKSERQEKAKEKYGVK